MNDLYFQLPLHSELTPGSQIRIYERAFIFYIFINLSGPSHSNLVIVDFIFRIFLVFFIQIFGHFQMIICIHVGNNCTFEVSELSGLAYVIKIVSMFEQVIIEFSLLSRMFII